MGGAGPRLHPGPHRLARAHRSRGARGAHVRAELVLRRRAARGRRARADHARGSRRGHARLPLHADRRRGAPRRVLRPLLPRGRRARGRRAAGAPGGDQRAPQPRVPHALRRDAAQPRGPPGRRAGGPRDARRGDHDLPHDHRGDAGADRPALHHRLQRAGRHAARLRGGLHQRRARRAPPRGLRRALPARHGPRGHALRGRDPAHARRGRAGGRGRAAPEVDPRGRGRRRHALRRASVDETRAFALQALQRRLKVIGLATAA